MDKPINELCSEVLNQLKEAGYTEGGIGKHANTYRMIMSYAESKGKFHYCEELGRTFVMERYGATFDRKRGNNSQYANEKIVHLEKLWHYQNYGTIYFSARSGKKKPFCCPESFRVEYDMFFKYCHEHDYSEESRRTIIYVIKKMLIYLESQKVSSISDISSKTITKFLEAHADCSVVYLKNIVSKLRIFFQFLYHEGLTSQNLTILLPQIHQVREAFLPSSWTKEDISKLISTIDRNNPCGKRDYAMLILVIRLGLRSKDIHNLKLSNFDWNKKVIRIIQSKTSTPMEQPLPDDVGWAIIDYLRNGRPKTDEHILFVRHSPEGGPISQRNKLQTILHKYMRRAGLEIPKDEHRGLHSLRSSLARIMLETGTPLPVISEVLGHSSTKSTSHYLKINVEALKRCPLDPEGVFCYE